MFNTTATILNMFLVEYKENKSEAIKNYVHKYKLKLREELKQMYANAETYLGGIVVNTYYNEDGIMKKLLYPGQTWSEEEIKDYLDTNWNYSINSSYDCTGKWFTDRMSVFNTPNGVIVYMFDKIDI